MRKLSMYVSRTLLRTTVLVLCSLVMYGQTANTGAIAGSVSDPKGALVPAAALVVKSARQRPCASRASRPGHYYRGTLYIRPRLLARDKCDRRAKPFLSSTLGN